MWYKLKNPTHVAHSNQFNFSPETLRGHNQYNLYNRYFKEYLFVWMQIKRGLYGSAVDDFALECYQFHLELLHDDLVSIDKERFYKDLEMLQKVVK